jgi:hypothetical protein
MSRKEKILKRFLNRPKDFTWQELRLLLNCLEYVELKSGKTSGSRIAFYNNNSGHIIRLHKPHPGNILKSYQIDYLFEELSRLGVINER